MESKVQERITLAVGLLLTAGFILKMAVESGYLTPERRIGLAILCGFGLIGFGLPLVRAGFKLARPLPGAGLVTLYLTAIAAHRLYSLIPIEIAIAIAGSICGLCIWLHNKTKNELYLLACAVGAFGAPTLLTAAPQGTFALYYLALCSIAFVMLAIWLKSRALITACPFLAVLATAAAGYSLNQDQLSATILAAVFAAFSAGIFLFLRETKQTFTARDTWIFLPPLLAFYAAEYQFLFRLHPDYALWAAMALAAWLTGLYFILRKWLKDGQSVLPTLITLIVINVGYFGYLPVHLRPWSLVVVMVASAVIPVRFLAPRPGTFVRAPLIVIGAVVLIEYVNLIFRLLTEEPAPQLLLLALAAFCSIWLAYSRCRKRFPEQESLAHVLLGAAHLVAVVGLFRSVNVFGVLAVSAAWLLYAVFILIFAFLRKDEVIAKSALVVLSFATAKGLLYDAATISTGIRIVCLFAAGGALYGSGFLVRILSNEKRKI